MKQQDIMSLTKNYINVATWSYKDMPFLDLSIAFYQLNIKINAKLVSQHQWKF